MEENRLQEQTISDDSTVEKTTDISLAQKELNGWEPKIQLDEGLDYTINYYKNLI